MNKKKILYFVEAFGGGVFTYISNLANTLCKDFDIYVAYGVRKQTPSNFEKYFDKRIHLIPIKNYQREVSFIKDLAALKEMKKVTSEVQPDIIHLNSSKAGILGRWLYRNSSIPTFYTPHGYSFLMTDISKKKKHFYKSLEKFFAFKNIKTIACSKSEYKITKLLTSNCTYVDNGINLNEFKGLISKKVNYNFPIIVTLGRISVQKNPALFNSIAKLFPDLKFIWIGDGELKTKLTAPNIEITGWIDSKEALKYLNKGDVFLLTSLWEGLPMALLEAMYLRKICLVSDVVGNKDVIKNAQNGFVCSNEEDFRIRIREIREGKVNSNLTKNAKLDILNCYNSNIMAKKYKKIYLSTFNR
ncbi:glycosyltransferase [Lactobacillus intestinalis]|uniref:glycosyltransferase n=1 Tax=Lactobacillus intestinalis TaxID=151781 RepID=UPI001F564AD6|nr:glycosyltransferase [Lactobacillus intestinalis]